MSRRFLASAMPIFMRILDRFQFLHPQVRECVRHVSMETNEWMTAFNVYLGVASLFDCLNNWLDADSSPYTSPILDICAECVDGIEEKKEKKKKVAAESGLESSASQSLFVGDEKNISGNYHGVVEKVDIDFNEEKVRNSKNHVHRPAKTLSSQELMNSNDDPIDRKSVV